MRKPHDLDQNGFFHKDAGRLFFFFLSSFFLLASNDEDVEARATHDSLVQPRKGSPNSWFKCEEVVLEVGRLWPCFSGNGTVKELP